MQDQQAESRLSDARPGREARQPPAHHECQSLCPCAQGAGVKVWE